MSVLILSLALSSCVNLTADGQSRNQKPLRPTLTSLTVTDEGGICMNKPDTALLLKYINALERECGIGDE